MPAPYGGGCQCGAVRYEIRGEPVTFYICHCTHCQKQSASAFGMSFRIRGEDFHLLQGKLKSFTETADSGRTKHCSFCPECGTRIYHGPPLERAAGGTINIKAGTLDDRSWLKPIAHIWTRSAQPWVAIPDDALTFETSPDDPQLLLRAWADRHGGGSA